MKYIYVLENNNEVCDIKFNKENLTVNHDIFLKYNNHLTVKKQQIITKKNIEYRNEKSNFFKEGREGYLFLLKIYGMQNNSKLYINSTKTLNDISPLTKKTNFILTPKNNNENEINKSIIIALYNFYDILEIGGNVMISLHNFVINDTFNVIYLLSNFFEKIIIIQGLTLFCVNYKVTNISKDIIAKIFNNDLVFSINPKNNLDALLKYLKNIFELHNKTYEKLLKNDEDEYIKLKYKQTIELLLETGYYDNNININLALLFINYFRVKFNEKDKNLVKITSEIRYEEGEYIKKTIEKNNFKKCLEIGFANGISAVYILMNKDTTLISIDPNQKTEWKSEGIKTLKKFDLNKNHKLIEKKSYEALPELLKKEGHNSFDFIFIDGWHTFDYTLVDFFYADLLLKIDGIIIIDDALHSGVSKCVNYIDTNYNFYKKLDSHKTIASYKKIKNDDRPWNFHKHF